MIGPKVPACLIIVITHHLYRHHRMLSHHEHVFINVSRCRQGIVTRRTANICFRRSGIVGSTGVRAEADQAASPRRHNPGHCVRKHNQSSKALGIISAVAYQLYRLQFCSLPLSTHIESRNTWPHITYRSESDCTLSSARALALVCSSRESTVIARRSSRVGSWWRVGSRAVKVKATHVRPDHLVSVFFA